MHFNGFAASVAALRPSTRRVPLGADEPKDRQCHDRDGDGDELGGPVPPVAAAQPRVVSIRAGKVVFL